MNKEKQIKKDVTLDDLALMVAKGFDKMDEKFNKEFKELKADIKDIKSDTKEIKANLNKKVDTIEYNTLEYRVEKLEKRSV